MNNGGAGDVIAPDVSSGPRRMAPLILTGWISLTASYLSLLYAFRNSKSILGVLPPPGDEHCVEFLEKDGDKSECVRADLFSFQVASGVALTSCAVIGIMAWHVTKRAHVALPRTPEGRLFGYLPEAELLAALNFTFQSWDFAVSLTIPEHATPIMLGHHLMAAMVSWCSVRYQYLHYYGIFFLGITEVSSIFLVFVDLARYFPPVPGSAFDTSVGLFFAPLFAATFLYYRVVLWWPESYRLWSDVRHVVRIGRAGQLRPGASWVLYLFLALNLPLGLMQLYWSSMILAEVKKTLQL